MSVPAKKQQIKPVQSIVKPQNNVNSQKPQINSVPMNLQKQKPKNPNA